jgi:hypothetical protein
MSDGIDRGRPGRSPMGAGRRWLLGGLAVVVAIALGVAAGVWMHSRGEGSPAAASGSSVRPGSFPSASPVPTAAPVAPFTDADSTRISAALSSPDPATTATVLASEFREQFLQSGVQAVPPGSTITLLTDRFTAVRPDYASVPFTVVGPQSGNFVAVLLYEDGQWLVATTQEVE